MKGFAHPIWFNHDIRDFCLDCTCPTSSRRCSNLCTAPVQLQASQVMPHADFPTGYMMLGLAVWLQVEAGNMEPASCRQLMQLTCPGEHHRYGE